MSDWEGAVIRRQHSNRGVLKDNEEICAEGGVEL